MDVAAVVVAGGDPLPAHIRHELPDRVWVVAADSGLDRAREVGLTVDLVIGDLDSASRAAIEEHTGQVQRHPPDKDATDLELALDVVRQQRHIDRVIVVGGFGGRADHFISNVFVVASPRFAELDIEWLADDARIHVVRSHVELHGVAGDIVTLLPVWGPAEGVLTEGLRWPLRRERLEAGSSRGVSNELISPVAMVSLAEGCLLTIQPGQVG